MAMPQVELLLRRQGALDAERGLLALRVATVGSRGSPEAMRDLCNDLIRQMGRKPEDTPFKRLLKQAKERGRSNGNRN